MDRVPAPGRGDVLQTGRETTQSNREQLEYWATGLSPLHLEQALIRARGTDTRAASLRVDGHAVRIRSHDIIEALRGRF